MAAIEEVIRLMPPITRAYVFFSVMTMGACALELLSPWKLYLNWSQVLNEHQFWRLITNFFYFGDFGVDFLLHMYFLYRYCKLLEINSFRGKTADFLFMLLFGASTLLAISSMTRNSIPFLGPALTFMMVYVWGRRNERMAMNFLGLFNFRAPYLPWVLLLFSVIFGSAYLTDVMGVIAGHVYYYLHDIFPIISGGKRILWTPQILCRLVGNNDDPFADGAEEEEAVRRQRRFNQFGWGQEK